MQRCTLLVLPVLAACATASPESPATSSATARGPCRDKGLDGFTGRTASAALGKELLKLSGARTLRWGAPGLVMTTEFRPDRLTVSYDAAMLITSMRCG